MVLAFWMPSCEPCETGVRDLVARELELEREGIRLLLVAVLAEDEPTEVARQTLASWGVIHPFLVDREDVARRPARVEGLPATLVLDDLHVARWVAPPGSSAENIVAAARAVARSCH